ncbi:class I SAM-dependent methyltransferase [Amphibiibacter pelophylacis]|uniref:Cyclopropane-fatty-acyl-phospholipid synthase family protein n=1 Tax=Amphibiibacter pelophylacis TaxID=1799477 RepID=A0ACC6P1Z4_9BURK
MTLALNTIRAPLPASSRNTRTVLELLEGLEGGSLQLDLPDGQRHRFGHGPVVAALRVHDEALFSRVLAHGDIGLAESYIEGEWDAGEGYSLADVLTLLARNHAALRRAVYGSWPRLLMARLRHLLNRNSRKGSQRNIMAHYDLGNEFYRQWLDGTMSYSSALFLPGQDATLESAQRAKYRRILDRLHGGQPTGAHVLEIGCGWGGFAEMAVEDGLAVTGLTLSPAQLEFARQRVPQADLRLQDYRDTRERYDHIVSIEMIEAVGERWWPHYFRTLSQSLKPGGKAVVQAITLRDDLFSAYRKSTDFIQQHVFPGGMLPSRQVFERQARRQGLKVSDAHAFGLDYARTLAEWRERFEARWHDIAPLGFDAPFRRLWRFYLAYCEAGFQAGTTDVIQFELQHA